MSAQVLSDDDIRARLSHALPHWHLAQGVIERVYRTAGWKGSLMVVNTVGHLAEAAWHHPEVLVSYPSVTVRLNTHDAGGVTEKDFALAAKIEEVVMWRPARDGVLDGTPDDPAYAYIRHD
jgi:pterin-4a-carbinolamine dehydratase